ncbi:MAG: hypothetical protein KA100_06365 [Rickettsiales bacterium]|nr:hypothetical protein [Rickettsiales bacterium]
MQKKFFKKIFAAIFCLSFACKHVEKEPVNPHILSNLPHIQFFEKQDHAFCSSLKINFDKSIDMQSGLYWRCRMSLTKHRLRTDDAPDAKNYNLEISDLVTKISLKLADTPESILTHENNKMDERHHKQCLVMGYIFQTEDQAKIDDYFSCRRALIIDQQLVPPFGNLEYLDYPNHSYNIGFVVDRRIDKEIKRYNLAKEKYPTCVKFHLDNVNFTNCTIAQDRSRQCFAEIDKKRFLKEMEEKVICQKMAYLRFPNDLLKEDDRKKAELERKKNNSDFYNNNSFAAIGVSGEDFATKVDEKIAAKNKKELRVEKEKEINSAKKMYDKFELTRLRQKFIFSCQKEADLRVTKYVEDLKKECASAADFVVLGE